MKLNLHTPAAFLAGTSLLGFSAFAAVVAALAACSSTALALPVWAMFMGSVAYVMVMWLREVAPNNDVTAYWHAVVTHFAAHLTPAVIAFVTLGSAGLIGEMAARLAHCLQTRLD